MLTLEEVKNYLRVDFEDDDNYIKDLIVVAENYLRDGITNFDLKMEKESNKSKARMIMRVLISNLYDERYLLGTELPMVYMIRSMLNQLEYNADV